MAVSGTGTIPMGQDYIYVADKNALANSMIGVMLTGNPSSAAGGALIEWIEIVPSVGFTAYLTNPVQAATPFGYKIS